MSTDDPTVLLRDRVNRQAEIIRRLRNVLAEAEILAEAADRAVCQGEISPRATVAIATSLERYTLAKRS